MRLPDISNLDYTVILCSRLSDTRAFYQDTMGFPVAEDVENRVSFRDHLEFLDGGILQAFHVARGKAKLNARREPYDDGLPQHRYTGLGIAKPFQITTVVPQLSTLENVRVALQALTSRYDAWRPRCWPTRC